MLSLGQGSEASGWDKCYDAGWDIGRQDPDRYICGDLKSSGGHPPKTLVEYI